MKNILYGLMVIVIVISITACGKEDNSINGTYNLIELSNSEETYNKSVINQLGLKFQLIIKDDKNAVLEMSLEKMELTYDDKVFTGTNNETGEKESIPYTRNGNRITITLDDEKMVFEK